MDPKTLTTEVRSLRERFRLVSFVIVGDRGMIGQKQIDTLQRPEGMDWITALSHKGVSCHTTRTGTDQRWTSYPRPPEDV